MNITLYPGGPPAGINLDVPSVVAIVSGSDAVYSDTEDPFVVKGNLAVGESVTLKGTFFFRVAMTSLFSISAAPDPLEARVAALEAQQ